MSTFEKKYAPTTFEDLIFPDSNTRQRLWEYGNNKRHGSLIFHGPYGTAKTTTAKLLEKMRAGDAVYGGPDFYRACDLEANSFERIPNVRGVQTMAGVEVPLTIVDEVDKVEEKIQYQLRWELDLHGDEGCFIFTTNQIYRVDPGLVDRCDVIELPAANTDYWFERARWIMDQEQVKISDAKLKNLLSTCDGSIRDLLRALEDASIRMPHAVN
jgi:DNA polymerase III delta prime subunit